MTRGDWDTDIVRAVNKGNAATAFHTATTEAGVSIGSEDAPGEKRRKVEYPAIVPRADFGLGGSIESSSAMAMEGRGSQKPVSREQVEEVLVRRGACTTCRTLKGKRSVRRLTGRRTERDVVRTNGTTRRTTE